MTPELLTELRLIADRYGYTHAEAKAHADEVWAKIQAEGPPRLAVVNDAWTSCPGTYSYYNAARALEIALRDTEL